MGLTNSDKALIKLVFTQLMGTERAKILRGVNRRREMFEALEAGIVPTMPRVHWINDTAIKLLNVLTSEGDRFNAIQEDDLLSIQDLLDVVSSVAKRINSVK